MGKPKKRRRQAKTGATETAESEHPGQQMEAPQSQEKRPDPALETGQDEAAIGLVESPEAAVDRLTAELEQHKDRYLRLAADFDNFRKRVVRERSETWLRAQADVVSSILDGLDDLARVAALDLQGATAQDVLSGVELVERKLIRELGSAGLQRVGVAGERFDPNDHEAVSTAPAPDADQENLVAMVLQPGYRFGSVLLRPARVQVFVESQTQGDGGE